MVQMKNLPYITLRFKFYKKGALQYISHLDLVRTMHKIIVRAGFPLWYTEGFNPKPKLIFGAPLSIGCESNCEFLDVRLMKKIDEKDRYNKHRYKMSTTCKYTRLGNNIFFDQQSLHRSNTFCDK